jgi:hypothetical protein
MEKVFGYKPLLDKIVQYLDIKTILNFMKTSYDVYIVARRYRYMSKCAPLGLRFLKYDVFDTIIDKQLCRHTGYIPILEIFPIETKNGSVDFSFMIGIFGTGMKFCESYVWKFIDNINIEDPKEKPLKECIGRMRSFLSKHPIIRRRK